MNIIQPLYHSYMYKQQSFEYMYASYYGLAIFQYYHHCAILGHAISTLQTYFHISIESYVQYIAKYCHTLQSTTVVFKIICTNNYYLNPQIHTNTKVFIPDTIAVTNSTLV